MTSFSTRKKIVVRMVWKGVGPLARGVFPACGALGALQLAAFVSGVTGAISSCFRCGGVIYGSARVCVLFRRGACTLGSDQRVQSLPIPILLDSIGAWQGTWPFRAKHVVHGVDLMLGPRNAI